MMPRRSGLRGAWICGVALLVMGALAAGCGRPPDEAWLRFLGFKTDEGQISVVDDKLREETTVTVDADFENKSLYVGQKSGAGILVNRARIDYRMSGFSPPSAEYPLNLYLAPPADGAATTGTLTAFPLVSTALKQWLINTGAFDDAASDPIVELTARVTFFGETDDGATLETEGSIRIELTNSGASSTGTSTTVNIYPGRNVSQAKTGTTGTFTVYRTGGSLAAGLEIKFKTSGETIAGTDYTISTPVVIPALSNNVEIMVAPAVMPLGATGTVIFTLSETASYDVAYPQSATININP